ncbi:MAG: hypothetical protein KC505_09390 [Myxococcales bacterium]|nr:hypothetical protein [Myxococcales bacterium]USN49830.1 MAG: hypothetical protein H6731_06005 [Myxococcales bacterium]
MGTVLKNSFTFFLFAFLIFSCSHQISDSTILKKEHPQKHQDNIPQPDHHEGPAPNRYEERQGEQLILRRALSSLPAFYGDGQVRFTDTINGSVFLFSDSLIMTNAHVVTSDHDLTVKKNNFEYIVFPYIVFYKKNMFDSVKAYEEKRYQRMLSDQQEAIRILSKRIVDLEKKPKKSAFVNATLKSYQSDLEALTLHPPIPVQDKEFLALEDSIDGSLIHGQISPDIAFIVLKKPLRQMLKKQSVKEKITNDIFAAHTLYNKSVHGRLFNGTPLYIAGYGREGFAGNSVDKNKSIKVLNSLQSLNSYALDNIYYYYKNFSAFFPYFEKDFYYYEQHINPGDSGAKIWTYLDKNNKPSLNPSPLSNKRISVGINNADGGGEALSERNLQPLLTKLQAEHPNIYRTEIAPLKLSTWPSTKHAQTGLYLLNLSDGTGDDLYLSLYQHFLWSYLNEQLFEGNQEKAFLWYNLLRIIQKVSPLLDKMKPKQAFEAYGKFFAEKLQKAYTQGLGDRSPSDLSKDQIIALLLKYGDLNKEQEVLLKKMASGQVFDQFKNGFSVTLKNLPRPIPLENYLASFSQWVERNAFKSQHYIKYFFKDIVDDNRKFKTLTEIIELDD